MLKKIFCFLVFFCFGFKHITFALQPFATVKLNSISDIVKATTQDDISLLHLITGLINMELNGEGHKVFSCKVDKQQAGSQQIRFNNETINTGLEYHYQAATATTLQHLADRNRKFSVPAHYNFLFRLTPF